MPWPTAASFKKHNKNSRGAVGTKAARMATGILKKTGDEGKAIRIANSYIAKRRGLINRGKKQ